MTFAPTGRAYHEPGANRPFGPGRAIGRGHAIHVLIVPHDPAQVALKNRLIGGFGEKFAVREVLPDGRRVIHLRPGGALELLA